MRFRLGLAIGFGSGYYLGAKAGRSRYEQMDRWINKAKENEVIESAAEKAKAVVDPLVERAKDLVDRSKETDDTVVVDVEVPVHGNGSPPSSPDPRGTPF
ncbi:MAG: hypothetical protein LC808_08845 [Actinobacteria bacterium]|nr:hypothetical protein [Actinomycetota bacterium]